MKNARYIKLFIFTNTKQTQPPQCCYLAKCYTSVCHSYLTTDIILPVEPRLCKISNWLRHPSGLAVDDNNLTQRGTGTESLQESAPNKQL